MSDPRTRLPAWPGVTIERDDTVWNGRCPLQVVRFRYRRFDGAVSSPLTWELWRRGRAAAVLPYDPWTDQVVLLRQFRLPALAAGVNPVMTEIPAGMCDAGESDEITVRREIVEEIGLQAQELIPLGRFVLTPGGADESVAMFVGQVKAPPMGADGVAGHGGLASEGEDIQVLVMPALDAIESALRGEYPNSVATIALLWLGLRRVQLRRQWLEGATQ